MKAEVRVSATNAPVPVAAVGRALLWIRTVQDGAVPPGTPKPGCFLVLRKTRTGLQ
jgi:NAD(P)-dependent dehydrogenase (short-subunit alcohol dehydrogenase family)